MAPQSTIFLQNLRLDLIRIVHECHCILQLSPIWTTHKKMCQCNKALQGKGCSEASGNHSYILMYLPKSALLFLTHSHRTYIPRINNVFDVEGNTGQLPTRYRVANLLLYWELMVAVPFILQQLKVRKSQNQFFLASILSKSRNFFSL